MDVHEAAVDALLRWKTDPVAFVREVFKAEPDAWQMEALEAFPRSQRLAMKAAKGPGKTAVLAWLIWNFMATRPHPKVAATSITEDNLADNLWSELAKWQQRSPFLRQHFTWTRTRIVCNESPETWFCAARTWPKHADAQRQAETLAGLHADHCLFVLDESGGIPQAVMTTAEAVLASGIETKVVQSGNPTTLDGPLYRACVTDRALWTVIEITGDPDNPKRSPRIDIEWARQQIATYGRENPWVAVNVLGQFPPASLNALLGVEDVQDAMKRHLRPDAYQWAQKRLGVDVARFGDDRTVLFPRQGLASFVPRVMRHGRGTSVSVDIATAVLAAKARWGAETVLFDATGGWAAGAVDVLRAGGEFPIDIQFHAPADDPRYANRRAELWFAMAKWVQEGGALPPVPELLGELITPTYTFVNGKLQLEPKDQIKQRLGRSPDLADALALTFGLADQPAQMTSGLGYVRAQGSMRIEAEFDPYRAEIFTGRSNARAAQDFDPFRS
jgi:phage terminase large subunit